MQNYLTLIREEAQFRKLWLAQVISLTGDWFNTIALVILVNRYADPETGSLAISALFLARTLPVFLASPVAGLVADHIDRRLVLAGSNLARVGVVLGFLLVDSPGDIGLLYILTITQFTLSAFFEPAYAAILPSLVPRERLLTANTLGSVTWSVMLTLGAVAGGVVAGVAGVAAALVIDAMTFAAAGTLILTIRPAYTPPPDETPEATGIGAWQRISEGWRYARTHPPVFLYATVKAISQVGSIDVMIAVYAERIFRQGTDGALTLGILFSAHGLGALIGPILGDILSDGSQAALRAWITGGFVLLAVGWFVFGIGPTLTVVALGMVLRGMGSSIGWTYSSVLLQLNVPDRVLGRVFGLDFALFTLALSGATLGAGLLLDVAGLSARETVLVISALSIGPLLLWHIGTRTQPTPSEQNR
ncbi:MAG: MFS transporter [Anaerolineales bacterium]